MKTLLVCTLLALAAAKPPPDSLKSKPPPEKKEEVPYQDVTPYTNLNCGSHSLSAGSYTIKSPNHPSNYGNNFDCTYSITAQSGVSLSLSCSAFDIESHSSCGWDYLQVNGAKFCGTSAPSVSGQSSLSIQFHSDYSVVRSGYMCTITAASSSGNALSCGSHSLSAGSYTIKSPNHPSNYGNNFDCTYSITAQSGVSLSLSCSAFDIESHSSCAWDYFQVNGAKSCGTNAPSVSGQSSLNIQFHTDYSVVRPGYLCTITATSGGGGGGSGSCSCGVAGPVSRVVGGSDATVGEWRWQAGLVSRGQTRTWCGGSLINDRYVLTAAHCTEGNSAANIEVLLGDHRIGVSDGESRHTVAQIIDHPSYNGNVGNGYDYSLLKLSAPVTFDARRAPVCLPTAGNTYAGVNAYATGFGRTGATAPQATTLQEVVLPVRPDSYCGRYWTVRPTTICAGGYSSGGRSVCMGDSGGPLVTLENGKYALIGVVSYGRPCAIANWPDMFARVTAVLPWIQTNTADATYCS